MKPESDNEQKKAQPGAIFSSHVRIQKDRGQTAMTAGPYAIVRHPAYVTAIMPGCKVGRACRRSLRRRRVARATAQVSRESLNGRRPGELPAWFVQ